MYQLRLVYLSPKSITKIYFVQKSDISAQALQARSNTFVIIPCLDSIVKPWPALIATFPATGPLSQIKMAQIFVYSLAVEWPRKKFLRQSETWGNRDLRESRHYRIRHKQILAPYATPVFLGGKDLPIVGSRLPQPPRSPLLESNCLWYPSSSGIRPAKKLWGIALQIRPTRVRVWGLLWMTVVTACNNSIFIRGFMQQYLFGKATERRCQSPVE